jgi:hypothetical protein
VKGNEKLTHALKEWSAVVDALGNGIQAVLLRKYPPTHQKFFLYPTYMFSIHKNYLSSYFQPNYHDFVKNSVKLKQKGRTVIHYYAEVNEVIKIKKTDFEKLRNLRNYYIWSLNHIFNYFKDEKIKEAYIWVLKIYKIPEPQLINDLRSGALKYAKLLINIPTRGGTPVMDNQRFLSTISEIKQHLEQPTSCRATLP